MHKNALFLLKNCKNRPALGASPSDPFVSGGWGQTSLPDSQPPAMGASALDPFQPPLP